MHFLRVEHRQIKSGLSSANKACFMSTYVFIAINSPIYICCDFINLCACVVLLISWKMLLSFPVRLQNAICSLR